MASPAEPPVFALPHAVRSGDTDARGRMSLTAACEPLQESAARHAVALGVGADVLAPRASPGSSSNGASSSTPFPPGATP
jgi:hypothetical protein